MTRNDDEMARLRRAFAEPPGARATHPSGCPEPDRIWQAVRGELPPDQVREIVDHVAVCAYCAEDWRIAMAFEEEARAGESLETGETYEAVPRMLPPPVSRFRPWMAAAAAALVMTVAGIQMRPEKPVYRSGDGNAVVTREIPAAGRASFVLAWQPVPGAESYELLVTTSELRTVAAPKGLTETQYQVPETALADLPAGTLLHWRVIAVYPDESRKQSKSATTTLE